MLLKPQQVKNTTGFGMCKHSGTSSVRKTLIQFPTLIQIECPILEMEMTVPNI